MKKQPKTHAEFWEIIHAMEWGNSQDYAKIAKEWYAELGKTGMKALEKFVVARVSDLYGAVDKYEATGKDIEIGSDDGMSDLLHHVVGLGKAYFDTYMVNPKLLSRRYREGEYTESFAYCFQEPEPPRTKEQKDKKLAELLKTLDEVTARFKRAQAEFNALENIITCMSMTLGVVQHDRKEDKKSA